MGNPKFVIRRSDEQFHFHLTAANGEIILTSERYKTRSSAENGVAAVKESAAMERRYERRESRADEPYFVLKAGNNTLDGRRTAGGRVGEALDTRGVGAQCKQRCSDSTRKGDGGPFHR